MRFVQKDRGPIFLCTYRTSEVNKKFTIWHLPTRNAKFEMHISTVLHIWSKKTKTYQYIPSFPLNTIRRYLIILQIKL